MTVRADMEERIRELRSLTNAGTADYTLAGVTYWSDAHLQDILDGNQTKIRHAEMQAQESYDSGGSVIYTEYLTYARNWELSPVIQDVEGKTVAGTVYSFDAINGIVNFAADTTGATRYITGKVYDMSGAAAQVWRRKAAYYAAAYDISTDNHSLKRSQLVQQCTMMAEQFEAQSGVKTIYTMRSDDVTG